MERVEVRVAVKSLSDCFRCDLCPEVLTPHVPELDLCLSEEAIVATVQWVSVV